MTAPRKTTASSPDQPTSRRQRILGWAELGVDTAAQTQKQWNDLASAYADLALQAARNSLSWIESVAEQNRKAAVALSQARNERARAVLERLA